eukprot:CAMPEP_0195632046 /NCGR_PEP_ID=MMETSP0815-20121206/21391_1 /TAXON_ID=97485 /ORGANISM="Prymnesium parvum, Strain Texoma1" /LENGTH=116 /DNA_ID=CAMNT_0040773591 /DNA_START=741 /DNA_END=1090 /DNA_ORIENTATION=+
MVIRPQIAIRVVAARCTAAHRQNARCDAQDDLVKRLQLLVLGRRERAVSRDAHGDDSACAANQRDCIPLGGTTAQADPPSADTHLSTDPARASASWADWPSHVVVVSGGDKRARTR